MQFTAPSQLDDTLVLRSCAGGLVQCSSLSVCIWSLTQHTNLSRVSTECYSRFNLILIGESHWRLNGISQKAFELILELIFERMRAGSYNDGFTKFLHFCIMYQCNHAWESVVFRVFSTRFCLHLARILIKNPQILLLPRSPMHTGSWSMSRSLLDHRIPQLYSNVVKLFKELSFGHVQRTHVQDWNARIENVDMFSNRDERQALRWFTLLHGGT